MTVKEFYEAVGGDYSDAAGRLQSDTIIKKFLLMLPDDKSYDELSQAVCESDAEKAFRAVHTMKGIALNLSLISLANACSKMAELLRGQNEMPENVREMKNAVDNEYKKVCDGIKLMPKEA